GGDGPPLRPASALDFSGTPQAWTLGLELWFYLLAPFLVKMPTSWLVGLIAASLSLRAYCQPFTAGNAFDRALFPLELVFFLLGIVSFRCGPSIERLKAAPVAVTLIAAIGLCVVAVSEFISIGPHPSWATACAPFAALALTMPFLFRVTKSSRIDAALGALTYPVYMAQFLAFAIVYQATARVPSLDLPWWAALPLNLACLVVFSIAIDRIVAQPVDRLRLRFGARQRPYTSEGLRQSVKSIRHDQATSTICHYLPADRNATGKLWRSIASMKQVISASTSGACWGAN